MIASNAFYQYIIYVIAILKGFLTVDLQENWFIVESLLANIFNWIDTNLEKT
jgi:hypothetical protein